MTLLIDEISHFFLTNPYKKISIIEASRANLRPFLLIFQKKTSVFTVGSLAPENIGFYLVELKRFQKNVLPNIFL
jgi:hypothetical protein